MIIFLHDSVLTVRIDSALLKLGIVDTCAILTDNDQDSNQVCDLVDSENENIASNISQTLIY